MTTLTLPWPPRELSPNLRTHWRRRAPIAAAYKKACWALTRESGMVVPTVPEIPAKGRMAAKPGRLHLWLTFYPPDRRHRDDDNLVASFKAGRDGLALALGIDDRRFVCHPMVMDEIGGFVKVRITAPPAYDGGMALAAQNAAMEGQGA